MKIIIVITIIIGLSNIGMSANNKNVKTFICSYSDTMPRGTDTSYAQKQHAFYKDTEVIPHLDTLTANITFKQMDSIDYASKLKADSSRKKPSPAKKKKMM
jgi:hypothetical protein